MALVPCTECRTDISDKASSCPKCGCPTELTGVKPGDLQFTFSNRPSTPRSSGARGTFLLSTAIVLVAGLAALYATGNLSQAISYVLPNVRIDAKAAPTAPTSEATRKPVKEEDVSGASTVRPPTKTVEQRVTPSPQDVAVAEVDADPYTSAYGRWCGIAQLPSDGRAPQADEIHVSLDLAADQYVLKTMFVDNVHGPIDGWHVTQDCSANYQRAITKDGVFLFKCQATGLAIEGDTIMLKFGEHPAPASRDCGKSDGLAAVAKPMP